MKLTTRSSFVRLLAVMASYSYACTLAAAPNTVSSQSPVIQTLKAPTETKVPVAAPAIDKVVALDEVVEAEKPADKAADAKPAKTEADAAEVLAENAPEKTASPEKANTDSAKAEKPAAKTKAAKESAAAKQTLALDIDEVKSGAAAKQTATLKLDKSDEKAVKPERKAPGLAKDVAAAESDAAAVSDEAKEVAQLSQPSVPSLASELSTAPISLDSTSVLGPLTTASITLDSDLSIDPLIPSLRSADISTTTGLASPALTTATDSLLFNDTLRDSTLDLERSLLSLPPIGYDSTTSSLLSVTDLLAVEYASTTSPLAYEDTTGALSLTAMYEGSGGEFREDLDHLMSGKDTRKMSLLQTVCRTLSANQALRIEALRPEIANTGIESAEGEFDTFLEGGVGYGSNHRSTLGPRPRSGPDNREDDIAISRNLDYDVSLSGRRPTGTNYSLSFSGNRNTTNRTYLFYSNDLNLNITQNLLRGAGCEVNLISVWTAQNDFVISLYQLQNTLINLVTDVQKAYWDVYLGYETLKIRRTAYMVAREQRERTEEFVRVGRSAPLDALAAQAEEASRISDIINAVSNLKQRQLVLLRLINPENLSTGWRSLIMPVEDPILPTERLVPEERVRLARYYRPDLRQSQIDLANGELETIRTANGMLPQLDFVINLGLTGVGDTQTASLNRLVDTDTRNYQLGFQFSYPLQNRTARAAHRRSTFQKMLAEEAVRNFCQIIDVEVRTAILEIERTSRLIISTKVTEELRRRQLEAETEKFRVGRSTQIEVSQAQRDFVQAQLDRVTAEVANINAYLELYRVEGTALQRRGIQPIHITPESGVPAG